MKSWVWPGNGARVTGLTEDQFIAGGEKKKSNKEGPTET